MSFLTILNLIVKYKELVIGIIVLLLLFFLYTLGHHNGYKDGEFSVMEQLRKEKELAEKKYNTIAAQNEEQLSALREENNQLIEKVKNETEKDPDCSDKPMPTSRVQALTKRTSSR